MDQFDDKILQELCRDGRLPHTELGRRIGLSASATLRRVQELERQGVIKGYRAVVDPTKLGIQFVALMGVGLKDHTKASQEAFERSITGGAGSQRVSQYHRQYRNICCGWKPQAWLNINAFTPMYSVRFRKLPRLLPMRFSHLRKTSGHKDLSQHEVFGLVALQEEKTGSDRHDQSHDRPGRQLLAWHAERHPCPHP